MERKARHGDEPVVGEWPEGWEYCLVGPWPLVPYGRWQFEKAMDAILQKAVDENPQSAVDRTRPYCVQRNHPSDHPLSPSCRFYGNSRN
jgi:hypothetical protein